MIIEWCGFRWKYVFLYKVKIILVDFIIMNIMFNGGYMFVKFNDWLILFIFI